jgi:hypothetical protein
MSGGNVTLYFPFSIDDIAFIVCRHDTWERHDACEDDEETAIAVVDVEAELNASGLSAWALQCPWQIQFVVCGVDSRLIIVCRKLTR